MKRIGKTLAATAAVAMLAVGCSSTGDNNSGAEGISERTLIVATITVESFPYHDGMLKFKELVEEASDGKMTVDIYAGGQLGQERDINESILEGTVHIGIGAGALAAIVPTMNLLELPFLIQNQEHLGRIIESDVVDELAARIESEGGYRVLDWFSTGDSSIQTSERKITTPADLAGAKIRVIENPALADALQHLGANPTPMPYGEIYTGIQTGVVEGSTVDWGSVQTLRLYELIKYATSPNAAFLAEPRPVLMSNDFWSSLSGEEQKIIQDAMTEAAAYERSIFAQKQNEAVQHISGAGVEMVEIDLQAFKDALAPVWDKWAKDLNAESIISKILELAD